MLRGTTGAARRTSSTSARCSEPTIRQMSLVISRRQRFVPREEGSSFSLGW
jgi:hypothetical protein